MKLARLMDLNLKLKTTPNLYLLSVAQTTISMDKNLINMTHNLDVDVTV